VPPTWWCVPRLTPHQRLDVLSLLDRTEAQLGREAIDEGRRRAVVHGGRAEHWLCYDESTLVGYAMAIGRGHAVVEMCGGDVDPSLLERLYAHHATVDWWTRDRAAAPEGGAPVRMLELLTVKLPVEVAPVPDGATLRSFEPDRDAAAWIAQNNAAFADHPEQGAWDEADLAERMAEPWFDPSGFLVLEVDGRIAASCWTKVHELHPDRFGEIYVVSVDPAFQGRGLGRVMVTQGLHVLARRGVAIAVLFVDESNEAARALYAALGFRLEREDLLVRFVRPES
jgi:mycothiol synthase